MGLTKALCDRKCVDRNPENAPLETETLLA
jgi:hypothetical protein